MVQGFSLFLWVQSSDMYTLNTNNVSKYLSYFDKLIIYSNIICLSDTKLPLVPISHISASSLSFRFLSICNITAVCEYVYVCVSFHEEKYSIKIS